LRALPAASIWRARPSPPRKLQRGFPRCGDGDSCREADPEHSAPCRGSGKQPCSDRRRRRFLGLRVWGLGLRLGLWKSGKRIVQAERRIPRCGGFLVAGVLSFTREERLLREFPRCGDGATAKAWSLQMPFRCSQCSSYVMLPTEMSKTFPGTIIPLYYLQHFFGARAAATEPHPFFYLEKQMERYVCVCV
jgi:hypothetical protein